ncbi:MAG: FHA domain-containing protein [Deltaproteobacteria bacterium]|nr:FHA domain-containing protein [Deltaproteobacteria bacterium]
MELKTAAKLTKGGSVLKPVVADPNDLLIHVEDQTYRIGITPILVGRDRSNSIVLASTEASRFHAAIYRSGKKFLVRDLHSTNGVTVNGSTIRVSVIRPGDRIGFPDESFVVEESKSRGGAYADEGIVLFADVAGFTSLTERCGNDFVDALRGVFEVLDDKVLLHRGCPLKNLGDGIMAAFGIWPLGDRRYSATDEALAFVREASVYAREQTRAFFGDQSGCQLRFGLALGELSYHSEDNLDLLGDTVNSASRLESINKLYGTRIMVNAAFHAKLRDKSHLREIDTIRVKGKQTPITIFAVDERSQTWERAETIPGVKRKDIDALGYLEWYGDGLARYRAGDFAGALEAFANAERMYGDAPAACMRKRVQGFITGKASSEKKEWDGIWNMEAK